MGLGRRPGGAAHFNCKEVTMTDDKKTTSKGKDTKPQAPPPAPKGGRVADGGGVVKK